MMDEHGHIVCMCGQIYLPYHDYCPACGEPNTGPDPDEEYDRKRENERDSSDRTCE